MIGETILHYKIFEKLGEGGMGEVYKAQDTKLDRFVALKFLPSQMTASEDDKARFIQEAKAASAMNHPNVCTIHDIQEHEGQLFIVMEFIDGVTLRNNKQQLSEKRILEIAAQVADGLAAAHEKGIVHRDIKPENIMIRKDGIVQIMDFGLAKLRETSGVSRLTKAGTTMGTMGYMSPEQVQGLDVDYRTDIFSLGVVMYEMFAGETPFKGMHETAIMYEIVNVDPPPVSTIKEGINPELDQLILECLEKDKDERFQSAKELARSLRKLKRGSTGNRTSRMYSVNTKAFSTSQASAVNKSGATTLKDIPVKSFFSSIFYNPKLSWSFGIIFFIAAVLLLVFSFLNQTKVEVNETKASILPPHGINFNNSTGSNLTISPNGKYISFVGIDSSGIDKLWVRPVNSLTARPLTNTTANAYPFWSPDSKTIAYFDKGKLMKISLDAGAPLPICDAANGRGGSWSINGTIVFSPAAAGGLFEVPSSGGKPKKIIKSDTSNHNQSLRWACFLPDGNHFLYSTENSSSGSSPNDRIFLSSLDNSKSVELITASSNCQYADGFLLFVRQSILLAQKFNRDKLKLEGEAMPVAENLQYYDARISGTFAASQNGKLVYLKGNQNNQNLVLLNKNGNEIKKLTNMKPFFHASFSPGGNRIACDLYDPDEKKYNIWVYDLQRGNWTRLTFDKVDLYPFWTNNGKQITYASSVNGTFNPYIMNADGSGNKERLYKSSFSNIATDISPDAKYTLFTAFNYTNPKSGLDVIMLADGDNKKPVTILSTNFNEAGAKFSPNMKWITYQSDESGKNQVYVIPFNPNNPSGTSAKWQISINGGGGAKWMNNGKSIYFITLDNKIMGVDVNENGTSLSPGKPYLIFEPGNSKALKVFDINKKGTEITATIPKGKSNQVAITLVENWQKEVEGKK
jgi:serine/threonine protein kinase